MKRAPVLALLVPLVVVPCAVHAEPASRSVPETTSGALPLAASDPRAPAPTTTQAPASTSESEPAPLRVPPCAEPEAEEEIRLSTGCSGAFGLRGSVTKVRGAAAGEGAGLMVHTEGEEIVRRGIFNARGRHELAIGGGGAGFEGTLLGEMAFGFRIPVAARHGPIVRAGVLGYLRGNDAFHASLFELPQLQVGYQYMRGHTVFELGGASGVVLVGRYRGGDTSARSLGHGFDLGAYAVVQIPWARLGAGIARLPTDDGLGGTVDAAHGTICAIATPIAICADALAMSARTVSTSSPDAPRVTSLYAGLSFGFTRER